MDLGSNRRSTPHPADNVDLIPSHITIDDRSLVVYVQLRMGKPKICIMNTHWKRPETFHRTFKIGGSIAFSLLPFITENIWLIISALSLI